MYSLFRKEVNVNEFISAEKAEHGVSKLCEICEVPRSTFYYNQKVMQEKQDHSKHAVLCKAVKEIHEEDRGLYGKRRIRAALKKKGIEIALYAMRTIMKELNLESKH